MGRKRGFTISESIETLKSKRAEVKDYRTSQQLNSLILIKEDKYKTLGEVAKHVGIGLSGLQRWLKAYKEGGIEAILAPLTRNKPSKIITTEMHTAIEERLNSKDNPFSGYVEVQEWLYEEFAVKVDYKLVHYYLSVKMKARLKVPRKTNVKKDPEAEESFLKTAKHLTVN